MKPDRCFSGTRRLGEWTGSAIAAILGLTFLIVLSSPGANAATIELGGDESLNCVFTISGPLETGDADRFRDILVQYVRENFPEYHDVALKFREGDV